MPTERPSVEPLLVLLDAQAVFVLGQVARTAELPSQLVGGHPSPPGAQSIQQRSKVVDHFR